MRIISGQFKGRTLTDFSGEAIRPTSDRVKEALFNILMSDVEGARVLDLFCGSGNLGIEAISRYAREVVFNDCSGESIKLLKSNLAKLNASAKSYCLDYKSAISELERSGVFDIIFIDPPYKTEFGTDALKRIAASPIADASTIIVFERDRAFSGEVDGLTLTDERKYGKTYLSFFQKNV